MKTDVEKYEKGKDIVYKNVFGIIGGIILLWIALYFIPMDSFYSFVKLLSSETNITVITATFFTAVVALGFICFSFGFYGIKCILTLTDKNIKKVKKENVEIEKTVA